MSMDLLPFGSVATCPACAQAVDGYEVKYSEDHVTPAGDGRFVSIQTYGHERCPHLEKRCPHCGYGWLEEVWSSETEARRQQGHVAPIKAEAHHDS